MITQTDSFLEQGLQYPGQQTIVVQVKRHSLGREAWELPGRRSKLCPMRKSASFVPQTVQNQCNTKRLLEERGRPWENSSLAFDLGLPVW